MKLKGKNISEFMRDHVSLIDWVFLGIITFFCFIAYQEGDIWHTGGSSIAYLNGHIWDFYEYNKEYVVANNYMPTTYILFAIWNIPVRILGLITEPALIANLPVRMWYKLGTTLLFCATAFLIYRICSLKGASKANSIWAAFLFVSNPIAVYSQYIFGQYDIITTFFMVLGYYYYLKENNKGFVFSFAVALTCKYFALLVFLPLVLLREKNVWKVICNCLGVASLFIIETLFYLHSSAFVEGVFGFNAAGYFTSTTIPTAMPDICVIIVAWIVLCVFAFFKDTSSKDEKFKWSIFLSCCVMFISFGLSFWHPQWLLMAIPFLVLGVIFSEKPDIFLLIDTVMMGVFVVYVVNVWSGIADQTTLCGGVFSSFLPKSFGEVSMSQLFRFSDVDLLFSAFVGLLLSYVIFLQPSKLNTENPKSIENYKGIIRLRYIGGVLFFVIPSLLCVFML